MLKRYTTLITDQGMDASIPMVSNPGLIPDFKEKQARKTRHKWAVYYAKNYKGYIFKEIFENGREYRIDGDGRIRPSLYYDDDKAYARELDKEKHYVFNKFSRSLDGVSPQEYQMFQLRARYAGDTLSLPIYAIDENDHRELKHMSGVMAAFYIFDGLIKGYTEFGRFGETSKRRVEILNKMEDGHRYNNKSAFKKLRRRFFDIINGSGEEDEDII